jgi:hypothetical protein
MDLSCYPNSLVQVNIGANDSLNLDMSKLEDVCKNLLGDVRANLNKMRLGLSDSNTILEKYEDSKYVGSLRWLEENLAQVLFNDRDRTGLQTGQVHLKDTFRKLVKNTVGNETYDNVLR